MLSVYCVWDLHPLMSFAINLIIVPGILVCIECYSDCSRMGSHLVEPLCYGVVDCM